jgi:hypothetical protein
MLATCFPSAAMLLAANGTALFGLYKKIRMCSLCGSTSSKDLLKN